MAMIPVYFLGNTFWSALPLNESFCKNWLKFKELAGRSTFQIVVILALKSFGIVQIPWLL